MRNVRKIWIVIFMCIHLIEVTAQTKSCKRIGLVNPTTQNIEAMVFLVKNGYIKADSVQIVGILLTSQTKLLKTSRQYVEERGYKNVSFAFVNHGISMDSLFTMNSCDADFLRIFKETDAMIFPGGADISPKLYGESTFLTTELIAPERNWEISFLYHLIGGHQHDTYVPLLSQRPDYLILGICLGMQEMNVASGGSLCQDIPFQIYGFTNYNDIIKLPPDNQHKNYWIKIDNTPDDLTSVNFHHLNITKNSYLDSITFHSFPMVASAHHQSVKKLGKNFSISATSTDKKVIEAISNDRYKNVYGVQFHTDFIALYNDNATFKISPAKTIRLDKADIQFHVNFWSNFSKRLNRQK